jgi:hypothetical protein
MRNENEGLHRRKHRKKRFNDGKDVRKWNHKAYTNEKNDVSGWQSAKYTI